MARRHIGFDETEVVVGFPAGRRYRVLNLSYEDIQRIQFDTIREWAFIRRAPSERITIITGKYGSPIVYTRRKHAPFWDEYKKKFRKFAEKNAITFVDNTAGA